MKEIAEGIGYCVIFLAGFAILVLLGGGIYLPFNLAWQYSVYTNEWGIFISLVVTTCLTLFTIAYCERQKKTRKRENHDEVHTT